jgi:hypothetical protein
VTETTGADVLAVTGRGADELVWSGSTGAGVTMTGVVKAELPLREGSGRTAAATVDGITLGQVAADATRAMCR